MIKTDARDDAHLGLVDDVRGVQTAAQAHFEHHDVARLLREVRERHGGHKLELRGMIGHGLGSLFHPQRDVG